MYIYIPSLFDFLLSQVITELYVEFPVLYAVVLISCLFYTQ